MIEFIDSKYTREKYKKLGVELTDWQKATIIWNKPLLGSEMSQSEILNALTELAKETSDEKLKKQIEERVCYEEKSLECIMQNPNRKYVYVVKDLDDCDWGFFFSFETALKQARKIMEEDSLEMHIEKQFIVQGDEIPKEKGCGRWNPNLFPEDTETRFTDYYGNPIGSITIGKSGEFNFWWSYELLDEEVAVVDCFDINRFESQFFKIPYVHKAGMMVQHSVTKTKAVLETSKAEWDAFLERIDNGLYVDFSDNVHTVYCLKETGSWSHEHWSPFVIEPIEITEDVKDPKQFALIQAMEALGDYFAGDDSVRQAEIVLQTSKNYALATHEKSDVVTAEKVKDILW